MRNVLIILAIIVLGALIFVGYGTSPDSNPVVVWNRGNITGPEGSGPVYFEYYVIPEECLRGELPVCDINYLIESKALERADVTGCIDTKWSVSGKEMTCSEFNDYHLDYAKSAPNYAGFMAGYAFVEDGFLESFDWVRGTPYETMPWPKQVLT